MKQRFHSPEVLIVGAGPVGLFSALALSRRDIRVRIIDKAPGPGVYSYGLALHPSTLDLLVNYGILNTLLRFAYRVDHAGIYLGGHRSGEVHFGSLPAKHAYLAVIPQVAVEHILLEALLREGVTVEWNHRLERLQQEDGRITGTIEKLEERLMGYAVAHFDWVVDKVENFEVPYLIGADGHDSLVRRDLRLSFEARGEAEEYALFEFDTLDPTPREMRLVFDDGMLSIGWPLNPSRYRWGFQIPTSGHLEEWHTKQHEFGPLGDRVIEKRQMERLQQFLSARDLPQNSPAPQRVDAAFHAHFGQAVAESFHKGTACLVGDAAHTTSPAGVQSMNRGFLEAEGLASVLAGILRNQRSGTELGSWSTRTRADWEKDHQCGPYATDAGFVDHPLAHLTQRLLSALPASGPCVEALMEQLHFPVDATFS